MKLWAQLYALTWVLFIEIWLGYTSLGRPESLYLHGVLGVAIVALAYSNAARLRATRVPGRVKRIARVTFALSLLMAVLGVLVFFHIGATWVVVFGISGLGVLLFLHFVNAIAMITQSAATAIAYDMWEDHEFLRETLPGEVPPMTSPAPAADRTP